jgi:hypothetical protein
MARALIVILRNRETEDLDGDTVPVPAIPGTWSRTVQVQPVSGSPWVLLVDDAGRQYWWRTEIDGVDVGQPTKIVGVGGAVDEANNGRVKAFAQASDNAWTLPELLADNTEPALTIKAAWKQLNEGSGLPELRQTMAGHDWGADQNAFATVDDV